MVPVIYSLLLIFTAGMMLFSSFIVLRAVRRVARVEAELHSLLTRVEPAIIGHLLSGPKAGAYTEC